VSGTLQSRAPRRVGVDIPRQRVLASQTNRTCNQERFRQRRVRSRHVVGDQQYALAFAMRNTPAVGRCVPRQWPHERSQEPGFVAMDNFDPVERFRARVAESRAQYERAVANAELACTELVAGDLPELSGSLAYRTALISQLAALNAYQRAVLDF